MTIILKPKVAKSSFCHNFNSLPLDKFRFIAWEIKIYLFGPCNGNGVEEMAKANERCQRSLIVKRNGTTLIVAF